MATVCLGLNKNKTRCKRKVINAEYCRHHASQKPHTNSKPVTIKQPIVKTTKSNNTKPVVIPTSRPYMTNTQHNASVLPKPIPVINTKPSVVTPIPIISNKTAVVTPIPVINTKPTVVTPMPIISNKTMTKPILSPMPIISNKPMVTKPVAAPMPMIDTKKYDTPCSICLCDVDTVDDCHLVCGHPHHLACIKCVRKQECPVCRGPLTFHTPINIDQIIKNEKQE